MKTTLVLHGWGGDSHSNWFPWLKSKIEFITEELYIPTLPDTLNPVLETQLDYINVYSGDFKQGGNIVGHSLGCKLALKFVEEHNVKNSTIILVAPTYSGLAPEMGKDVCGESYGFLEKYFDEGIDFSKLNTLNNEIVIFLSDDDPYINMGNAKKYYTGLKNVKIIEYTNKGHFNTTAGVLELEEILEYLK